MAAHGEFTEVQGRVKPTTELTREQQIVLLSLHEYSPLWEILYELREVHQGMDSEQVRARAATIVRDFASRGWVEVLRQRVVSEDIDGDASPVPISGLEEILGDDRNWLVPRDRQESAFDLFIFDTTPAAEAVIQAGAVDDVWPGGVERSGES